MKNYRNQNGCWNCKHVFVYSEYDVERIYYCNIKRDRPRCGSVLLSEIFPTHWKDYFKKTKLWNQWEKKHLVKKCGICDNYEKIDYENI